MPISRRALLNSCFISFEKRIIPALNIFSITNELAEAPGETGWSFGQGSGTITPALREVRKCLDAAGIEVPLSAPDWTSLPPLDPNQIDFDEFIGAYDVHSYGGVDSDGVGIIQDWVHWAHSRNKPFFLTEFGEYELRMGRSTHRTEEF